MYTAQRLRSKTMEKKNKRYSRIFYDDDEDGDDDDDHKSIGKQAGDVVATSSSLVLRSSSAVRQVQEPPPAKLREQLCNFLLCPLCQGYLIDATIASECGHAFCKSCITTYVTNNNSNAKPQQKCPVCDAVLNPEYPELPLKGLRADHRRQRIVFKLVPGLFEEELRQRVQFTGSTSPETRDKVFGETMGKLIQQGGSFYSVDEYCNAILKPTVVVEKDSSTSMVTTENESSSSVTTTSNPSTQLREIYIMTQLKTDVKSLKKFIQMKFNLEEWRTVRIGVCDDGAVRSPSLNNKSALKSTRGKDEGVDDAMTLHDIAYDIKWNRANPMRLTFFVQHNAVISTQQVVQVCSSSLSAETGDRPNVTTPQQSSTSKSDIAVDKSESSTCATKDPPPQSLPKLNSAHTTNAVATTNAAGNTVIRMPPPATSTRVRKLKIVNSTVFHDPYSNHKNAGVSARSPTTSGPSDCVHQPILSADETSSKAVQEKAEADTDDERIIVVDDEEETRISPIKISQLMRRHNATLGKSGNFTARPPKPSSSHQVLASECLKQASMNSKRPATELPTLSGFVSPTTKRTKPDNSNTRANSINSLPTQHKTLPNLVINLNAYPNVTGAGGGSSSSSQEFSSGSGSRTEADETSSVIVSSSTSSSVNVDNSEKLTVKLRKVDGGVWLPSAGAKLPPTTVRARKLIIRNSSAQSAPTNKVAPSSVPKASDRPPIISSVIQQQQQQQTAAQKLRLQTPPTSITSPVQSQKHPTASSLVTSSSGSNSASTPKNKGLLETPPSVTLTPTDNFRHSDAVLLRTQPPSSTHNTTSDGSFSSPVVVKARQQPNPNSFFLSAPPKNGHGLPDVMNSLSPPSPVIAGDFVRFSSSCNNSNYLNHNNMMQSIGSNSGDGGSGIRDAAVAAHRSGQMFLPLSTTPTLFQQYNYYQQQSLPSSVVQQQQQRFFRSPNPLVATLSPSSSLTDDAVDDAYQNAVLSHASPSPASINTSSVYGAETSSGHNSMPSTNYSTGPSSSSVQSAFTLLNAFRAGCLSMVNNSTSTSANNNHLSSSTAMQSNYFDASRSSSSSSASHEAMAAAGAAVAVAAFAAAAVSAVAAASNNSIDNNAHQLQQQCKRNPPQRNAETNSKRRKITKRAEPAASNIGATATVKPERSAVVPADALPKPFTTNVSASGTSNKFFAAKAVGLERVISRISSSSNSGSSSSANKTSVLQ